MNIRALAIGLGLLAGVIFLALIFGAYANPLFGIYLDTWSLC